MLILLLLPQLSPGRRSSRVNRSKSEPVLKWFGDSRLKCYCYVAACAGTVGLRGLGTGTRGWQRDEDRAARPSCARTPQRSS